jgi:hypothetical protein
MESPGIGPEEMQAHSIICGDSSTLQGQERDIIFLSMVADRAHARSMADRKAAQRFNVAMSRARDRLYLVRSVARSHLAETDLKHKVIAHFRAPLPDGAKVVDASSIDRCQSGFEREACTRLLEEACRVIPQVKVGAFSIDLVVEGAENRRLAIELDGDSFHGPERWRTTWPGRQRSSAPGGYSGAYSAASGKLTPTIGGAASSSALSSAGSPQSARPP